MLLNDINDHILISHLSYFDVYQDEPKNQYVLWTCFASDGELFYPSLNLTAPHSIYLRGKHGLVVAPQRGGRYSRFNSAA